MNRPRLLLVSLFALFVVAAVGIRAAAQTGSPAGGKATNPSVAAEPPRSLAAYFPPQEKSPVWLERMLRMSSPLSAVVVNLMENDVENAEASYEAFKKEYGEVSNLVPEWKSRFPMGPVNALGEALSTGDPNKVMGAIESVGNVCRNCHMENMVPVQQKYHWGDFQSIKVYDPLLEKDVDFVFLMTVLEANYTGVVADLTEGQIDNARKQHQGLVARYETLEGVCAQCHDTERKYYVDASVHALLDRMGEALQANVPNSETVLGLARQVGMDSCHRCHLVHVPAAFSQAGWQEAPGTTMR